MASSTHRIYPLAPTPDSMSRKIMMDLPDIPDVAIALNTYVSQCGDTFFGKSIYTMTDEQIIALASGLTSGF